MCGEGELSKVGWELQRCGPEGWRRVGSQGWPGGFGAAGASHDSPRTPKCAHLRVPALQTPPKFHEKTPIERRKSEISDGRRKKSEILGGPGVERSG